MHTWKRIQFAALAPLLALPVYAWATENTESTALLLDCFAKQVEIRALEKKYGWLAANPAENKPALDESSAKITQNKVELQTLLALARNNANSAGNALLNRAFPISRATAPSAMPEKVDTSILPLNAHALSPLEWDVLAEWFGKRATEAYLLESLAPRLYSEDELLNFLNEKTVFHLKNPYSKLIKDKSTLFPGSQPLELSGFIRIEDQVAELYRMVKETLPEGVVIVSMKDASAIVLRMLDMHPELRNSGKIAGWINLDGRLYGIRPKFLSNSEKAKIAEPVRTREAEYRHALESLNLEAELRMPPLGKGFPIWNILSANAEQRSAASLRESVVPEGYTYLLEKKERPAATFARALKKIAPKNRMPASATR
jgi:hypothetical protein